MFAKPRTRPRRFRWWPFAAGAPILIAAAVAAASPGVAPRPPLGWNSWDAYGFTLDEAQFKANAALLARWRGWHGAYAVIDEGWYMADPLGKDVPARRYRLDGFGRLQPVPERFPSAAGGGGLKALADWTHAQGLRFGIHVVRGIPKAAVAANMPIAGSAYHAADAADRAAPCPWDQGNDGIADNAAGQAYYDAMVREYAAWGVDFLKVDCIADHPYRPTEIRQLGLAIRRAGRPMVLSLSPGPADPAHADEMAASAQMWRISDDFWDGWTFPHPNPASSFPSGVLDQFDRVARWSLLSGPNRWADADMLPFGQLSPHPGWGDPRASRLSPAEVRTTFVLWAIARSPLILGGDLTRLDAATRALVTNPALLALDQEARTGRAIGARPGLPAAVRLWTSAPSGRAVDTVAVFNTGDAALSLDMPWRELDLDRGAYAATDLIAGRALPSSARLIVSVPAHDVALLRVRPNGPGRGH